MYLHMYAYLNTNTNIINIAFLFGAITYIPHSADQMGSYGVFIPPCNNTTELWMAYTVGQYSHNIHSTLILIHLLYTI